MKNLLLVFCCFCLKYTSGQTLSTHTMNSVSNQNIIPENQNENLSSITLKTLKINTNGYSAALINQMKDEFFAWKEKIVSVSVNSNTHEFILLHNQLLVQQELLEVLRKYGIAKNSIISYK